MVVKTRTLIDSVKKMYPVSQFFKNRYFPDGKCYYAEKALIEMKKQGRKIAPFVVPVVNGIVLDAEGYRAEEVDAPYIAPKMTITAADLARKAFGESQESKRTPAQRENEMEAEYLDELRKSILRTQEKMCTDIITTGETVMKHYANAEDAAKGIHYKELSLRFFDKSFDNRYVFDSDFTQLSAKEKLLALWKMAETLRKRGIRATDLVMTGDVSMLFFTDKDFLEFYNKKNVDYGKIKPEELPDGIVCNGTININGMLLTMFTYDDDFEDLDGVNRPFLPKGTIAMLRPNIGTTAYAQVTLVKGNGFQSYAERIIPRIVASEDNNVMEVQCFSRPVSYPREADGWMVANIYEKASETSAVSSLSDDAESDEEVTLLSEGEIKALATKQDVIDYAESIGLSGLTSSQTREELDAAVIEYTNSL